MALLADLAPAQWRRPTACAGWSVHDVALHLLGGQISNLSRRRDGFSGLTPAAGEAIGPFIDRINDEWMRAARRISPALLRELMAVTGPAVAAYFASLDPSALGGPVNWAGPEPAPVWLDVAREYTEWWHHQQHVRDAVARPGLTEPRYLVPALATFVHSLPVALDGMRAAEGDAVVLAATGPGGGEWTALRTAGRWRLFEGGAEKPRARVALPADAAWRFFTRGLGPEAARAAVRLEGDRGLAEAALRAVAIL